MIIDTKELDRLLGKSLAKVQESDKEDDKYLVVLAKEIERVYNTIIRPASLD